MLQRQIAGFLVQCSKRDAVSVSFVLFCSFPLPESYGSQHLI